jgi:alpha-D-ribose 1-methylphosphonate 5-triphosphate synthase subunit PhnG
MANDEGLMPRQRWMAVLARATGSELAAIVERHGGIPPHEVLKRAETGTVMIEARAGGTGARFNLGEATVSRCTVRLEDGTVGVAYALGSDRRKALLAALLDGLLQSSGSPRSLAQDVEVLARSQSEARQLASRKAAATKVDFYTLVRGNE